MQQTAVSQPVPLGLTGDAMAWLELERSHVEWDAPVAATLVLAGGIAVHRITRPVEVSLIHSSRSSDRREELAGLTLLPAGCEVRPGDTTRYPIRMRLPWGIPFRDEVSLWASIYSGLWCRTAKVDLRAAPPAGAVMIAGQFGEAARMSVAAWDAGFYGEVTASFAPAGASHPFTRAVLALSRADGAWYGRLTVLRATRSLVQRRREIGVPFLPPDPAAVRERFRILLGQAGFRTGEGWSLPLPARGPGPAAANLPLPASQHDLPRGDTTS